jgi:hypothetical protein
VMAGCPGLPGRRAGKPVPGCAGYSGPAFRSLYARPVLAAVLEGVESGIVPTQVDEVIVTPLLHDPSLFDDDDAVGPSHRAEAVGDDEDGTPLGDSGHIVLDDAFRFVVQGAGGFVENENARVGDQRSGNGDMLALAAGERAALLADQGVVAFGQFEDEVVGARQLSRLHDGVHLQRGVGQGDVLAHAAVKQRVLLQHHADLSSQPGRFDQSQVDTVDEHPSRFGDELLPG